MSEIKSVYFIGIGGIGMSALARYFNDHDVNVSGYDKTETALTKQLEQEQIDVFYSENVDRIPKDVDLVVYTPAIPNTHKELTFYKKSNIPVRKRSVVLGDIVNEGECFAVAGSHGKSTTSSMLAHVLQVGQKCCTAFLGAIATNYQSNYISGSSTCFVVEADEYDRSFHHIQPSHTIITSVDSDHLDVYGDMKGVKQGFLKYVEGLRPNGKVFIPYNEPFKNELDGQVITYGLQKDADYYADNIKVVDGAFQFTVKTPITTINDIILKMGGKYNIENAVGVIAMVVELGYKPSLIPHAFTSFKGLKRRFEFIIDREDFVFIDDYAHHPHEIRSFIQGVRELYPQKRFGAIFQPHLFTRTRDYADHFAESLTLVDEAIVMDVYPAREQPIEGVSAQMIIDRMSHTPVRLANHKNVVDYACQMNVDVLATIGAGDISVIVDKIKALKT